MGSVVEKKVCARLEISGSNPVYANVHISLKNCTLIVEGLVVVAD